MRKTLAVLFVAFLIGAVPAMASPINVDIYSGYSDTGSGITFSGYVGSIGADDILFATNTGYNWHPFGFGTFGADITGAFSVPVDGSYTFALSSDDGSYLFIGGILTIANGGGHGPLTVPGTAFLTAGLHPFEVQFFEDFGGASGVDLYLPTGVTYSSGSPVPEPASLLLFGTGLAGLRAWRKRRG